MPSITLSTGAQMPIFGLGTWLSKPDEIKTAVKTAVGAGYRLIDTAASYRNEEAIGDALKEIFEQGTIKRDDIFITTKLHIGDHARDKVTNSLKQSLAKLKMEYVDLFLIHTSVGVKKGNGPFGAAVDENGEIILDGTDYLETWKGMEDVYMAGLAKAIGLSNFNADQIQRVWDNCNVKPHNVQVECHLYFAQFHLHEFCKSHQTNGVGVSFTAYSPLGAPGRGEVVKDHLDAPRDLDDPMVDKLAEKYARSAAQILIRYLIQRGICAIPKSTNPTRIKQNIQEAIAAYNDFMRRTALLPPEELIQAYDMKAAAYDEGITAIRGGSTNDQFIEFALGYIKEYDRNASIIDIGAGSGSIGEKLHSIGFTNVSAHDGSKELLKIARKRNVYNDFFEEILFEDTPSNTMPKNSFDLMVSVGAFFTTNHLNGNHFDALVDIVKPGGLILLGLSAIAFDDRFKNKVKELSHKCTLIGEHTDYKYITVVDPETGNFIHGAGKFLAFSRAQK